MVAPSYNSEDNQVRAQAKIAPSRSERYIETIASLDQWSMTIETIETNGMGAGNHLMVMVE